MTSVATEARDLTAWRNRVRSGIRAHGEWTVLDHVDVAWLCDGAGEAVRAAGAEARRRIAERAGADRAARAEVRCLGIERERRGDFVAFTARVEAFLPGA